MGALKAILVFLRAFILGRAAAAFENLAPRQQLADTTRDGTAVARRGHLDSKSRRAASSILACGVIANTGLPDWFAATVPRVTVKRPDSRGISDFFVAIFAIAPQFVWSLG